MRCPESNGRGKYAGSIQIRKVISSFYRQLPPPAACISLPAAIPYSAHFYTGVPLGEQNKRALVKSCSLGDLTGQCLPHKWMMGWLVIDPGRKYSSQGARPGGVCRCQPGGERPAARTKCRPDQSAGRRPGDVPSCYGPLSQVDARFAAACCRRSVAFSAPLAGSLLRSGDAAAYHVTGRSECHAHARRPPS